VEPLRGRALWAVSAVVLLSYAVVGAATLTVGQLTGLASPIWPAAGIALAATYVWGWRVVPAVLLGSILANGSTLARQDVLTWSALAVTVVIGLGAAIQAGVGARLVATAVGTNSTLTKSRDIVLFLILGGPVASLIGATFATLAQVGSDLVSVDRASALWITWWVGDSIGVVIFAPLTLMLIPSQARTWARRRLKVAVPSLIGAGLFVALFVQAEIQATNQRDLRLEQLSTSAAGDLQREVARHQEALEGLSSFFESSEVVDSDEFSRYANDALERFPNLQALSWNPLLAGEDRARFEESQRSVQRIEGFQVTERDEAGELVPASNRSEYVPVAYIEPLADNLPALGFDINSNPVRKEAIDRARNDGIPSATAPIDLVQESGSQKGMLALVPVFGVTDTADESAAVPETIVGFTVGVYRLGDLLQDTFDDPAWDRVDVRLVDVTDGQSGEEMAFRSAREPATVDETTAARSAQASDVFEVYGRTWQIEVLPTSGPLAANSGGLPLNLEILGLVVLLLLQAFVLVVTGLERDARRQASAATREANTDALTGLQNRRAFLRNLEAIRSRSMSEGSSDVLMYIDLDEFKQVNDEGGHEAGDRLLKLVADALSRNVRTRDLVARLGGDEFAVVLHDCPFTRGLSVAKKLEDQICSIRVPGRTGDLSVGVSIGVAAVEPGDGLDVDALIRRADDAAYAAKASGGGVRLAEDSGAST